MRIYSIASIPGDGIGQEVIPAGLEVLCAVAAKRGDFQLRVTEYPWGSAYYRQHGVLMPDDGLKTLKSADAIYFGAVGATDIPDHITLWGLRLKICQGLDQYANVRPARVFRGVASPLRRGEAGRFDMVIVRENSEGEYAGHGGRAHQGHAEEVGTETAIFTRAGCVRIFRFAYRLAQSRPRKLLTQVTKSNAMRHGMVLWDEVGREIAQEFPDVKTEKMLVDAMTARMVRDPESLDVIVATNLHADILSDLAAALAGSLGIAPTANLNPEGTYPSMFEPIHGSAFDIAGKGIANPIGAMLSGVMMLEHLGERKAALSLSASIERVLAKQEVLSPDLGGRATTKEVVEAIKTEIAEDA
jgi:tartrate dehydrogenase/decarboxylase / D-malate dehydrogenase